MDSSTLSPVRLANRRDFYAAVDAAAASGRAWTVVLLDLDRFGCVNARYGWEAGDAVLQTVAERLARCVDPGDTVVRTGGDEFGVLVTWAGDPDVAGLALQIISTVEERIDVAGGTVEVGCTIGIGSAAPDDHPITVLETAERDHATRKAYRREALVTTAH